MPDLRELIPPPPRSPHPAWAAVAEKKFLKLAAGSVLLGLLAAALVGAQFLAPGETPLINRVAMGVFAVPLLYMCAYLWSVGSKDRREHRHAWAEWPLWGVKEQGGAPQLVPAESLDLQGILSGRVTDQRFVLVDPAYKFNRREVPADFLRRLVPSGEKKT
jgi:hypothetical protein